MEQRLEVERFREPKGGNSRKARNRRQGPKRRRLERALRTAPTPHPHSLTEGVSVNQAERVPPGESQEGCFSRSERQAPRQGSTTEKRSRPRGDARILRRICRTPHPLVTRKRKTDGRARRAAGSGRRRRNHGEHAGNCAATGMSDLCPFDGRTHFGGSGRSRPQRGRSSEGASRTRQQQCGRRRKRHEGKGRGDAVRLRTRGVLRRV